MGFAPPYPSYNLFIRHSRESGNPSIRLRGNDGPKIKSTVTTGRGMLGAVAVIRRAAIGRVFVHSVRVRLRRLATRLAYTEDGVTGRYALACLQRRVPSETDMRPRARGKAQKFLDDGRPLRDRDLLQPDLAPPTLDDPRFAGGARVPHPLALPQHRHEIVLSAVLCDHHRQPVAPACLPPRHFQRDLTPWWQSERRPGGPTTGKRPSQRGGSVSLIVPGKRYAEGPLGLRRLHGGALPTRRRSIPGGTASPLDSPHTADISPEAAARHRLTYQYPMPTSRNRGPSRGCSDASAAPRIDPPVALWLTGRRIYSAGKRQDI